MFTKLRNRLTLISIFLTLTPVLFISITLGSRSFTDSVNNSLERQRLLSNRVSQAIQDTFSQRVNELTVLGNSAQLEHLPPAEVQGLLANLMHNQAYDSIIIVNPHGEAQSEAALFNTVTSADLTNQ